MKQQAGEERYESTETTGRQRQDARMYDPEDPPRTGEWVMLRNSKPASDAPWDAPTDHTINLRIVVAMAVLLIAGLALYGVHVRNRPPTSTTALNPANGIKSNKSSTSDNSKSSNIEVMPQANSTNKQMGNKQHDNKRHDNTGRNKTTPHPNGHSPSNGSVPDASTVPLTPSSGAPHSEAVKNQPEKGDP